MTPRQLFKAEVLAALASRGNSPTQCAVIIKSANLGLVKRGWFSVPGEKLVGTVLGEGIEGISRLGSAALPLAIMLGVGLPLGVGAVGGHMLAKSQEDDTDVDAVKSEELIQTYDQLAEDAKRKARFRGLRTAGTV